MNSGPIERSAHENWSAIQVALVQGCRGLPGGSSLARLLAQHRGTPKQPVLPRLIEG